MAGDNEFLNQRSAIVQGHAGGLKDTEELEFDMSNTTHHREGQVKH